MKKILKISALIFLIVLVSACGTNSNGKKQTIKVNDKEYSYKIDAPYYGNITIGNSSINMLSTTDMLTENNITRDTVTAYGFKDKSTGDKFNYERNTGDNYYEVEFQTHNSIYEDNGCRSCHVHLSNYVELPKGITYNSTVNDVIKAYGNPDENNDYDDDNYRDNKTTSGGKLGTISATKLVYKYTGDNENMTLNLYFAKSTGKLYRVVYTIRVKN